jgi:hypothetical protein
MKNQNKSRRNFCPYCLLMTGYGLVTLFYFYKETGEILLEQTLCRKCLKKDLRLRVNQNGNVCRLDGGISVFNNQRVRYRFQFLRADHSHAPAARGGEPRSNKPELCTESSISKSNYSGILAVGFASFFQFMGVS